MVKNTIGEKIVYTVLKDLLDISAEKKGLDNLDIFRDVVNSIAKDEFGGPVAIKKPAVKKDTGTTEKKKVTRKTITKKEYKWIDIGDGFECCQDIQFADGYYVFRNSSTKEISGAVGNDDARDLTFNDKTILAKLNF